jgi:tripartite-type tricarboxylate transporter receptor subunit TctC
MTDHRLSAIFIACALVSALVAAPTVSSAGQPTYPSKAIQVVVPFAPGGGTDVIMRMVVKFLSAELGVPVNVVNKPGGNQVPAVLSVLNAPPDGHTLLTELPAASSIQSLLKDLPYKIEDRTFGPMLVADSLVYVVGGKSPWNSLKDVAEAGKKDPASITWTRLGGKSLTDFSILQFLDAAGIDIAKTKPVNFDGSGPGVTAVAGGHVAFGNTGVGAALPLRSSGDLKVLALTGDSRVGVLSDVPTTTEAGYPGVDIMAWYALSGPKNLPQHVVDRLDQVAKKLTDSEEFRAEMRKIGVQPRYMNPGQLREYILKEMKVFQEFSAKVSGAK